jgi:hypothetical protein
MTRKQMLKAADVLHFYARSGYYRCPWPIQVKQATGDDNPRRVFVLSNHLIIDDGDCAAIEASILASEAHSPNW